MPDDRDRVRTSKLLSYVLRHRPDAFGVTLDAAGWVDVAVLLSRLAAKGHVVSREALAEIVATNPKRRFELSPDGRRIRASQGHSVDVELGYAPATPPAVLFHGTVADVLPAILAEGLRRMARHHVHLCADEETATAVGRRRGRPVVLRVDAAGMTVDGHLFYLSANGVWLTEHVPPAYLAASPAVDDELTRPSRPAST